MLAPFLHYCINFSFIPLLTLTGPTQFWMFSIASCNLAWVCLAQLVHFHSDLMDKWDSLFVLLVLFLLSYLYWSKTAMKSYLSVSQITQTCILGMPMDSNHFLISQAEKIASSIFYQG